MNEVTDRQSGERRRVDAGPELGVRANHYGLTHYRQTAVGNVEVFHGSDHVSVKENAVGGSRQAATVDSAVDRNDLAELEVR